MESRREYERFVAPIEGRMLRSIWRIVRNPDDVEDVLQESLVKVVGKMPLIRLHRNPPALILRICVHCALDHLRRRRRQEHLLEESAEAAPHLPEKFSPEQMVMQEEQRRRVLDALGRLPARQAEAMTLLIGEEMSYAEVAALMGCREPTVRVLARNARQRLRKELVKEGFRLPKETADVD